MATFKSLVRRLETMKFYTCAGIAPYILIIYMNKDTFLNDVIRNYYIDISYCFRKSNERGQDGPAAEET